MDDDRIAALLKIGDSQHMQSLLREGVVHMKTFGYFAGAEADEVRRDRHEGADFAKDMDGWSFDMEQGGSWQNLGTIQGLIVSRSETLAQSNIYCLHARLNRDYGTPFELESLGFGDSFVLFTDANEFFRRLEEAASNAGQTLEMGMVDYFEPQDYEGPVGPFRKTAKHSSEREFRIAAYPGIGQALTLRLGDLSDIAVMGPTNRRLLLSQNT